LGEYHFLKRGPTNVEDAQTYKKEQGGWKKGKCDGKKKGGGGMSEREKNKGEKQDIMPSRAGKKNLERKATYNHNSFASKKKKGKRGCEWLKREGGKKKKHKKVGKKKREIKNKEREEGDCLKKLWAVQTKREEEGGRAANWRRWLKTAGSFSSHETPNDDQGRTKRKSKRGPFVGVSDDRTFCC